MTDRLLTLQHVRERTSLSKTHIYRLVNQRAFPRPVALSPRRVAWIEAEVDVWIAARVKERDG